MKEIFYFLQWQWRKFELWQKAWLFGAMLFGAGLTTSNDNTRSIFFSIALGIYAVCICKWVFWDGISMAWNSYQKEKQQVVDIMKDGIK